jgi:glucose/arabinose dehydrogenase
MPTSRLSLRAVPVLLALLAPTSGVAGQQMEFEGEVHDYRVTSVVEGLEHPWGLVFLPNGDMLVTERPGRLRIVRDGTLDPEPVTGVPPVAVMGQGGMLDIALHPDFATNRILYLSYAKAGPGETATTAVTRAALSADGRALRNAEEIWVADAYTGRGVHFGSRIVFDADGKMYVSVGDRGEMREAQNPENHQGTINRLNDDGSIPEDNPFYGEAGVQQSIYTWGNRSPQGLAVHPMTGEIWETEHGPRGGDELNRLQPGANYGWPTITYGINYNGSTIGGGLTEMEGMEQPVSYWVPSIATSGLVFYDGDRFPQWRGDAFVGGLAGLQIARVDMDGNEAVGREVLLDGFGQRIRAVVQGPDGYLYGLVDTAVGSIFRIEPR